MPKRSQVVDQPTVDLEWEIINLTSPRFDYYDGRVLEGLRGSVSGSSYQGALDPGGIITACKCPRTQGSSFCFESFLQQSKEISCPSPNEQQNSSCLPTKNGGTRFQVLVEIAQELWEYALRKEISLTAEYLPGDMNHEADWQSRHFRDASNSKLNPKVFHTLDQLWGPLAIDLFADRKDKAKIRKDQGTMVLIAPTWHAQAWYTVLWEMCWRCDPILLSPLRDLLLSPNQQPHPLILQGYLQLAAWVVTGKTCLQMEFQRTLQICSAPIRGENALHGLTTAPGNIGVAGVVNGRLIHFAPLWPL